MKATKTGPATHADHGLRSTGTRLVNRRLLLNCGSQRHGCTKNPTLWDPACILARALAQPFRSPPTTTIHQTTTIRTRGWRQQARRSKQVWTLDAAVEDFMFEFWEQLHRGRVSTDEYCHRACGRLPRYSVQQLRIHSVALGSVPEIPAASLSRGPVLEDWMKDAPWEVPSFEAKATVMNKG